MQDFKILLKFTSFFFKAKRRKEDTSWTKVKIVILFQMYYLGFSPSHLAQAYTRLYGKHNTLVPPRNHPWRNTLFLGGKYFLKERRGPAESRSDFSAWLFCCSDLFWNLSDFWRLAHAEGVAVFGKRLWIFLAKLFIAVVTECGACPPQPPRVCTGSTWWGFDRKRGGHPEVLR